MAAALRQAWLWFIQWGVEVRLHLPAAVAGFVCLGAEELCE